MITRKAGNYYTSKSRRLLKQMDQFLSLLKKHLVEKYGEARAASIRQETLTEYEKIIPALPDIGGKENPLIQNLIKSASALALYRVLKSHPRFAGAPLSGVHKMIRRAELVEAPRTLRQVQGAR